METAQDLIERAGNGNTCEKCGREIPVHIDICQQCVNKIIEEQNK